MRDLRSSDALIASATVDPRVLGPPATDCIEISWEKFHLANGLTVVVAENRAVPLVTVNIWYKVGAKDEPPGKTGLAHLFEHLMFGGSANMPGSYLSNMGQIGALDLNGTTNPDRTNFHQTVQTGALDLALFAESDRMGHFLETLGPDVLEQQRNVVLNEKRQTEGAPYGQIQECVVRGMYPAGHPYSHSTLGWQSDVESLTLEDARAWFRNHYCPSNAVLVLAGDVDITIAREKVSKWFGHIPAGPSQRRPTRWVPANTPARREVLEDRVPSARLVMAWNVPPAGDMDASWLMLAASVLGGSPASLLHRWLVDERKMASSVAVGVSPMLLSSQLIVVADVLVGGDIGATETEIRNMIAAFIQEGPSAEEIERQKIQAAAGMIGRLERGQAVADLLAMNEMYFGDPGYYRGDMERFMRTTADEVRAAAARWLGSDPAYTLQVLPRPDYPAAQIGADRRVPPIVDAPDGIALPPIGEATIANGLRVLVAERHDLPLVNCRLILPRGLTMEPRDRMGLGTMTADLMSRGAGDRDAEAFRNTLQSSAIQLSAGCSLDFSGARISALTSTFGLALDLMADVLRRPRFEQIEVDRARAARLEAIKGLYAAPAAAVGRVLTGLMFGAGHPYTRLGEGLPGAVAAIERDDVVALHARLFQPTAGTFVVVGDTTLGAAVEMLEARFGDWRADVYATQPGVPAATPAQPGVYLIDRPGAPQSLIAAALLIPSFRELDPRALRVIDSVLGGVFGSRLNMNLREDKSWTYGVRTEIRGTLHERVLTTVAPVQVDKTSESMAEILREYIEIGTTRPIDAATLAMAKQSIIMGLPSRCQTLGDIGNTIEGLVQLDLPLEYWSGYAASLRALSLDDVNAVTRSIVRPERLVWIVAGDRALIENGIRRMNFGPVHVVQLSDDRGFR